MNITAYLTGGLALAFAVVYGLWTYDARDKSATISKQKSDLATANASIATANNVTENNAKVLKKVQADLLQEIATRAKYEALAQDRASALWKAKQRINNAPKQDDGPVARVLSDTIDQLRVGPGSNPPAGSPDGAASGAAADSNQPVVPVPADPPAS